jgi:hypothetical protein
MKILMYVVLYVVHTFTRNFLSYNNFKTCRKYFSLPVDAEIEVG